MLLFFYNIGDYSDIFVLVPTILLLFAFGVVFDYTLGIVISDSTLIYDFFESYFFIYGAFYYFFIFLIGVVGVFVTGFFVSFLVYFLIIYQIAIKSIKKSNCVKIKNE